MANTCYDGNWWAKTMDEEGTFRDHNGNVISTWMGWTDVMGQAIDDQMCATKAATLNQAAAAASTAIAAAVSAIPAATPPTKAQVQTALSAPGAALTPPGGASLATVQVLGLTVIAGAGVTALQNNITRVNEIEARLKALGLLN